MNYITGNIIKNLREQKVLLKKNLQTNFASVTKLYQNGKQTEACRI